MIDHVNIILVISNIAIFYPIFILYKSKTIINNNNNNEELIKTHKLELKRKKILFILLFLTLLFSCLQHLTERNSMKYGLNGLEIYIYNILPINLEHILLFLDRFSASITSIFCIYDIIKRKVLIYKYPYLLINIILSIMLIIISDHFLINKNLYMMIHSMWHFSIYICFGNYLILSMQT